MGTETPSLSDLRHLYFGGGPDAEYALLKAALANGVTAYDSLQVVTTNAVEKIDEIELLADGPVIDFQNIDQSYENLRVEAFLRTTANNTFDNTQITLDNDVADAKYFYQSHQIANNANVGGQNLGAAASRRGILVPGATAPANHFARVVLDIPAYAGNKIKSYHAQCDLALALTTGNIFRRSSFHIWNDVAAINRIMFDLASGASYKAGSKVNIYGVKSAFM